jgi:hypothetical protein
MSICTCRWCGKKYESNDAPVNLGWDRLYYCSTRCKKQYENYSGQSASKDDRDAIVGVLKTMGIIVLIIIVIFVGYAIWYGIQHLWHMIF